MSSGRDQNQCFNLLSPSIWITPVLISRFSKMAGKNFAIKMLLQFEIFSEEFLVFQSFCMQCLMYLFSLVFLHFFTLIEEHTLLSCLNRPHLCDNEGKRERCIVRPKVEAIYLSPKLCY